MWHLEFDVARFTLEFRFSHGFSKSFQNIDKCQKMYWVWRKKIQVKIFVQILLRWGQLWNLQHLFIIYDLSRLCSSDCLVNNIISQLSSIYFKCISRSIVDSSPAFVPSLILDKRLSVLPPNLTHEQSIVLLLFVWAAKVYVNYYHSSLYFVIIFL